MSEAHTLDVRFRDEGSIVMVEPLTEAAKEWVRENVPLESWQWLGSRFCCEPRMVKNLMNGMVEGGLNIEG